jgi:hypothetical protein
MTITLQRSPLPLRGVGEDAEIRLDLQSPLEALV